MIIHQYLANIASTYYQTISCHDSFRLNDIRIFFFFASQLVHHGDYHKRLCLVHPALLDNARRTQPALWRSACWGQNDWELNPKVVLMV